jgi:hypothetical protein
MTVETTRQLSLLKWGGAAELRFSFSLLAALLISRSPENRFGGRAPWSQFLKFLKFDILKFQKFPEKNPRCSQ